jgi:hypothetical protein
MSADVGDSSIFHGSADVGWVGAPKSEMPVGIKDAGTPENI